MRVLRHRRAGRGENGRIAPRHRAIRWMAVTTAAMFGLALTLALAALAGPANARESSTVPHWRVVATAKSAFLSGLVGTSRHSIWALGTGMLAAHPERGFPVGLHWNGRSWSKVSFPQAISKTGIGCA